ncbi:zinc finger and BTB domain-containing protein 43 isoform X3 [Caloenas nicobarica]|uniref:zinc finger and BTB domain-containing protein 43 isoform X3 n=1 Tax=Caloenas nicobarica TaxID=187106 RepID=UPI0032B6FF0E
MRETLRPTGRLVMPAPEIVSYLTAASFLQMWHVVDKCTEVLEGNPTVLCQKMNHVSDHQSPSSSSYNGLVETFELGSGGQTEFHKAQEIRDGENEEEISKDELSCQLTEHEYLPSNSSTEHDRLSTGMTSQDGEEGTSDSAEYQYTRPMYSKPSIMSHKRWIHVKPERFEQDCEGVDNPYDEHQVSESMNAIQADHSIQSSGVEDFHIGDKKMEAEFDEQADESNYDEQVDFYGSSMEEFSGERADGNLSAHRQDLMIAAGYGEGIEMASGIKEETSLTGFSHADKLYCGKNITKKNTSTIMETSFFLLPQAELKSNTSAPCPCSLFPLFSLRAALGHAGSFRAVPDPTGGWAGGRAGLSDALHFLLGVLCCSTLVGVTAHSDTNLQPLQGCAYSSSGLL